MSKNVLLGRGRAIVEIAHEAWEQDLCHAPQDGRERLSFMSEEHHRVRRFVVTELPQRGVALGPQAISEGLQLPTTRVGEILDDLERNLFFLARNGQGEVSWAYPVTVDETPHRLSFSSGERLYGA
jgi:hypothetical protein